MNPVVAPAPAAVPWPDDAVEVGRVLDAWGIKGWIRVQPYAAQPQVLLRSRRWFLDAGDASPLVSTRRQSVDVTAAKVHGEGIVASVAQCADRTAAETLRGARVFVSRGAFPAADVDEYYWVDLIGASVVNRQGEALGIVRELLDTGAHSVLVVSADPSTGADTAAERLIPFVAAYVDQVDLAARRIVVDWGLDY